MSGMTDKLHGKLKQIAQVEKAKGNFALAAIRIARTDKRALRRAARRSRVWVRSVPAGDRN